MSSGTLHWQAITWSGSVHDVRIDGGTVRYADHGAGPAIVLIHGLGGSWQTWLQNIPALAREHRVIALDLPGFGASHALPAPAEMATHADVLATLLDRLGLTSATIVGHSMGGLVALELLAARPDLVERLVLANAGGIPLGRVRLAAIVGGFKVFHRVFARDPIIRALSTRPRLRRFVFAGFMGNPAAMAGPFALEVVPLIFAPGFTAAVSAASRVAGTVEAGAITGPVLLVWGTRDRILPLTQAQRLHGALCDLGVDARLVALDGVGHCPMFEAPDLFNEAVLRFTRPEARPR